MEKDEMNFEILKSMTLALKAKVKFIFTTLNGLFPLHHSLTEFYQSTGSTNVPCRYILI